MHNLDAVSKMTEWSVYFQDKPFNIMVIQVYIPTSNGEEAKVECFYEDLATISSVQFSSVSQSCPTLCNPMNCSVPGLPVHHQLPEFTQTHVHRVSDAIQPSHPLSSPSPPAQSFPMSQPFAWGGQSTGVSASASFPPKKSQGWSPSEWTGWISLQSKELSRVFSNTTVQKHQFFGTLPSSLYHISVNLHLYWKFTGNWTCCQYAKLKTFHNDRKHCH